MPIAIHEIEADITVTPPATATGDDNTASAAPPAALLARLAAELQRQTERQARIAAWQFDD